MRKLLSIVAMSLLALTAVTAQADEVTQVSHLSEINALPDGTKFQFVNEAERGVFVYYQKGSYLYMKESTEFVDSACVVLVHGDVGKSYNISDVIGDGWGGTKTTVDGLVQVVDPTGFGETIGFYFYVWEYEADNETGYLDKLIDNPRNYLYYKVRLTDGEITQPDAKGYFTVTSTLKNGEKSTALARNVWNVNVPSDTTTGLAVEAMVSIEGGALLLYPIDIRPYEYFVEMYELRYYEGAKLDGAKVTLDEAPRVAASVPGLNLVFATDNEDGTIINHYGFVEDDDWKPDWICLDYGDNDEWFAMASQMKAFKYLSVKGVLRDPRGNTRLEVTSIPIEATGSRVDDPIIYSYDLTSSANYNPCGNEVHKVKALVRTIDGVPHMTPSVDSEIAIPVRFDYAPQLAGKLYHGDVVEATAIAKVKTTFNWDAKIADEYENYELYLLSFEVLTPGAISDVDTPREVMTVEYINPLGQVSSTPHAGLNLVKTTYTDGTTATVKVLR